MFISITAEISLGVGSSPIMHGVITDEAFDNIYKGWENSVLEKDIKVSEKALEKVKLYDRFRPSSRNYIYNLYGTHKSIRKEKAFGVQVFASTDIQKTFIKAKRLQKSYPKKTIHIASFSNEKDPPVYKIVVMYFDNEQEARKFLAKNKAIFKDGFIVNNHW